MEVVASIVEAAEVLSAVVVPAEVGPADRDELVMLGVGSVAAGTPFDVE